jgi:ABC-type uncharacterized transport system substrate-binding protein
MIVTGLMVKPGTASAHPHVWVKATSQIMYAEDGSIKGIRHAWTFDDMFSTYAVQGINTKAKGVYTREELAPLAQLNVESLKDFDYFTFAKADGKKQKLGDPIDYYLEYKDAALALQFTLPFKNPIRSKQFTLEVFDPTFFVDFALQEKDPIKLVDAPVGCAMTIQHATDGMAAAQKLGEQNFLDNSNITFGAMLPTRSRWSVRETAGVHAFKTDAASRQARPLLRHQTRRGDERARSAGEPGARNKSARKASRSAGAHN